MRLLRKGKTGIIAKLHTADSVICSHSGEVKPPSYSQINTVKVTIGCSHFYGAIDSIRCHILWHLNWVRTVYIIMSPKPVFGLERLKGCVMLLKMDKIWLSHMRWLSEILFILKKKKKKKTMSIL